MSHLDLAFQKECAIVTIVDFLCPPVRPCEVFTKLLQWRKANANNDVDLKIEKGALRSLYQFCGFCLAIEDALQPPVDLVTSDSADKPFLDMIGREEVLLYRHSFRMGHTDT